MRRAGWTGSAVAVAVAAALLPLWGDALPGSAVTHPEWARMILRGLDLLEGGGDSVTDTASMAFAVLSGRDSRSWSADDYVRSRAVAVERGADETRVVRPTGVVGETVYPMAVARGGEYRLRLRIAGPEPAEAEVARMGETEVLRSFAVPIAPVLGWVDAGVVHLAPGAYDASVLLPEGATLEHVELAPPCLRPIEPREGWRSNAVTTTQDVAVTVLQALDMEDELPPAAPPLEFRGGDLLLEDGSRAIDAADGDAGSGSFRGGPRGARVILEADIAEAGLYTLSVYGVPGNGQRWVVDGCRVEVVCPSSDALSQWRVVLSGELGEGRHYFSATLGSNAVIERIRLERKKDAPEDYVGTVERLGLDLGPAGDVTREKAEEARRFLERGRGAREAALCGPILEPGTLVSELAAGAGPGGGEGGTGSGGGSGGGGGNGGGSNPVPPPVIPPLPPASGTLPVGFGG
jgi:hypothetical protein